MKARPALLAGIFLVSLATLLLQVCLTRLFSAAFAYHFAFMIISLALFGVGLSGIAIYLFPSRFPAERAPARMGAAAWLFAASAVADLFVLLNFPFAPAISRSGFLAVIALYLINSLPFFFSGLALGIAFSHFTSEISTLYFCDLAGAGVGCLLAVPLLNLLGAPTTALLVGAIAAAGSFAFALGRAEERPEMEVRRSVRRRLSAALLLCLAAFLFLRLGRPVVLALAEAVYGFLPHARPFSEQTQRLLFLYPRIAGGLSVLFLLGAAAAAIGLLLGRAGRRLLANPQILPSLLTAGACAAMAAVNAPSGIVDLNFANGRVLEGILYRKWNELSYVIVHAGNTRAKGEKRPIAAWGMSSAYAGPVPDQYGLRIDAYAGTPINAFRGDLSEVQFVTYDIPALVYRLKTPRRALIIGSGGGIDILAALSSGCPEINCVEINPAVVAAMRGPFRDFSGGLYLLPQVKVAVAEGRSFIQRDSSLYDTLQLSMVDSLAAASSGAYALSENNLYTVEAFRDFLSRLEKDGILSVSRWDLQSLRTVSLALEALEGLGERDPGQHLMVFRSGRIATLLCRRTPFPEEEIRRLEEAARSLRFETLYTPLSPRDPDFSSLIAAPDREEFFRRTPFDVSPSTDDRPFFFQTMRPRDFLSIFRSSARSLVGTQSIFVLMSVLITATALAALFLFGPLLLFRREVLTREPRLPLAALLYFFAIGLAFMLLEVPLIQMFVLFLGHPVYAISVVLFSLLVACGAGSFLTRFFAPGGRTRAAAGAIAAIAVWAGGGLLFLPALFHRFLAAPLPLRIAVTAAYIAPLGAAMGMILPLGMKVLDRDWHAAVPWFWGVNGAASVMGSVWALAVSISGGFRLTVLAGIGLYLLAGLALRTAARRSAARA